MKYVDEKDEIIRIKHLWLWQLIGGGLGILGIIVVFIGIAILCESC